MLPPSPLSFLCALLLCLPLAIVFTIVTLSTTTTTITNDDDTATTTATIVLPTHITTTTNQSGVNQVTTFNRPTINSQEKNNNNNSNSNLLLSSPPPQPPSIADEDDEQLFRHATQVNPKPSPPRKLAFMFLTTTPLPFAPLWELYFNQTPNKLYNIYIHADPSFQYHPPFSGVFENRVIPGSKPTYRYSPTLISATRRLLSHALLHDPSNSMFALFSASCIPLHSFNFTYKTLIESKKSFIEILKNEHGAYDRWAARGEHAMFPELPFENFRIGSQFFVLTRKHARMVIGDRRLWSKFMLPCLKKYTCYPEEHYFPTLINLKDPSGCVPATLTHVDWRGSHDGHPRTYKASEVGPDLIMVFRSDKPRYGDDGSTGSNSSVTRRHDPFLFARKFSPNSVHRLVKIALNVILKD